VELLKVPYDAQALFKERPNRFLGIVDIFEPVVQRNVKIHIHDPGRLPDLLSEGVKVRLKKADNPNRKTGWDLLAVEKKDQWVFTNSAYHRKLMEKLLSNKKIAPIKSIKNIFPEIKVGESRLDFCLELQNNKKVYLETKGCTLALKGRALFPDAPTSRGRKHLLELIQLKQEGQRAALIMLIFRKDALSFGPHYEIDPEFGKILKQAIDKGVELYPIRIEYKEGRLFYKGTLPFST